MPRKRQNTKLQSEGAEFLVLGRLLIEGVACYKAYINYPGYDLIAVNYKTGKSARVQVKSRWATDYDKSFPIKNTNCDFVVHVALNRGIRFRKTKKNVIKEPEFFVFPIKVVKRARNRRDQWGKVTISNIPKFISYKDNWKQISKFLKSNT